MAILEILEAPHPVLEAVARPVGPDEFNEDLVQLAKDMAETMFAAPGVGLAAPQVGDGRRMLVANLAEDREDGEESPPRLVTMVNPEIVEASGKLIWEESCLSLPEFFVDVKRSETIVVRFLEPDGTSREETLFGFPAVVVQHEMDHLEGITLLNRASRLKKSRYLSKRKKRQARSGRFGEGSQI